MFPSALLQRQRRARMIAIMPDPIHALFSQACVLGLEADQVLFRAGDIPERVFLVVTGNVALHRHTQHGATLVLQHARAGQILAEASAYSDTYHCDAVATAPSRVACLPKRTFLTRMAQDPSLASFWAARLAREVQIARTRAEIRTLPRVSDRLTAWLTEGNTMPPKGAWHHVASELGITREALYRELSRRQKHK
ncbi:cAMP-binding domain of CRP or a regulatory subunit of cAMP-dependent protein kinases [Roseibaca calidilacus]|uniref:cAMP-binding domain of CRP or a regulatory subunit of cAMP-dependent protein kinases n=2 Tax=Roseibaca calidilacus TaxID=1666912 RepID=A0ABM9VWF8_9RHOB|nr:cAMP-binding domain of CRP or a regulatory subunit of cAMP-dependent protein kinases [Roseibaca calidilacus]